MAVPVPRLSDQVLSIDDIEDALSYVRCEDRTRWYRVALALWSELGTAGEAVWLSWGRREYEKFNERDAGQQWRSARNARTASISSVLAMALEAGWDWKAKIRKVMTPDEVAERERERAQRAKEAIAAEKKRHGEAAKQANELWDAATPEGADEHPYLQRKGVRAHGLRVGSWPLYNRDGELYRWVENALLIPRMNAAGKLRSLQAIIDPPPDGWADGKSFLRNGEVTGTFHIIGAPKHGGVVAFCEGYATGASIHEVTGWCVVVVFSDTNIQSVIDKIVDTMPGYTFVIAADNDRWSKTGSIVNPGVHHATEAGKVINCRVVVPEFASLEGRPTDFNDLHQREGAQAVAQQLIPALPVAANDNTQLVDDGADPDDVDRFGLPDLGGKGAVLPTHANLREICRRLGVIVRYNQITKEQEILIPRKRFSVDNNALASYAWLENQCILFRMPTDKLRNGLALLCDENQFNPVVAWISSKPWDGTSRLRSLFDTITPAPGETAAESKRRLWLRDRLVLRWMVSAVAAAFRPDGVAAQGMLVLQGPQNVGKTRWLMSLCPRELRLAREGVTLKVGDRDSEKQILSYWLNEVGELDATFRKSDIAALKSFITREADVMRLPYMPKENQFARRTVLFGSVNPEYFLFDTTGNRRFWTVSVCAVDPNHGLDMQQVWAEVLSLYSAGEQWHLTPEEHDALNASNEKFQAVDPVEERIQSKLNWGCEMEFWNWSTATDVLIAIGFDRPSQSDCTKAAQILGKLNGEQRKRSARGRLLLVPPTMGRGAQ